MVPEIVYQDDFIVILNKPPGWITNLSETTKDQPVVQTWIKDNLSFDISNSDLLRSGIVHRLDKETSGILVVAKTEKVFIDLQSQFKERKIQKTYTALVHGIVDPENGEINVKVGRLPWRRDRFGIVPDGRDSVTNYKVLSRFLMTETNFNHLKDYTLIELTPKTGRTHQIRIHMKFIGHPLVSDDFYTGRKTARKDKKWCPRLFLHASGISFSLNTGNKQKQYKFLSDLPDDLNLSLKKLLRTSNV